MFLWIVTAVDIGESCDGKARILKICRSKEEGDEYIKKDMLAYTLNYAVDGIKSKVDPVKMSIYQNEHNGCEWNLEKIHITPDCITSEDEIKKSEQILIDNGIEKDKAQVVLQSLGYSLLNIELYPEESRK